MKKRKGLFAAAALFAATSLLFSGCGGIGEKAASYDPDYGYNSAGDLSDAMPEYEEYDDYGYDDVEEEATQDSRGGSSNSVELGGTADATEGLYIIKTAEITIRSNDASGIFSKLRKETQKAGGFVQDSYLYEEAGYITLRIPAEKAETFINGLRDDYEIEEFSESSEDVSNKYVDNQARLESARAALDRYNDLLRKAETIDEILEVQDRIDYATAELEAYEATKRSLDGRVKYETITVTINSPKEPITDDKWQGLAESLSEGLFVGFAVFLHILIVLLYCLPFVVIILLIIFFIVRGVKKSEAKRRQQMASGMYAYPAQQGMMQGPANMQGQPVQGMQSVDMQGQTIPQEPMNVQEQPVNEPAQDQAVNEQGETQETFASENTSEETKTEEKTEESSED